MSYPVFRIIGSLKSRSVLSSAITAPQSANDLLSSLRKKFFQLGNRVTTRFSAVIAKEKRIPGNLPDDIKDDILSRLPSSTNALPPPFPETEDQIRQREYAEFNVKQLTRPEKDPKNEQLVMDILRDFTEKRRGMQLVDFDMELQSLLESERLKNLGVYARDVRIPDKQEWKRSWFEKGKPTWLGTTPTDADGLSFCTATVSGYSEEDGRKGGYGVIICDSYGRPVISSVGVLPKGHGPLPLLYFDLHGVRSALQLAYDSGFGSNFDLYCGSCDVEDIIGFCLDSIRCEPMCMDRVAFSQYERDEYYFCSSCLGFDLCNRLEDFDILFPVIKEIIQLLSKLQNFCNIHVWDCEASAHLAKCYIPTTEEMKSKLLDEELGLYEIVMKPDQISEEVVDILYDEAFIKDKLQSSFIQKEKGTEANEATHPNMLHKKMSDYHISGKF